jgi:hypothetical protein
MREYWNLPGEESFRNSGKDSLLLCLSNADKNARAKILLLCWRPWHLRNDVIHQKGRGTIAKSVSYLWAFYNDHDAKTTTMGDDKGKAPMYPATENNVQIGNEQGRWSLPT